VPSDSLGARHDGTPVVIGPITDSERRGWQRRAVRVLGELLGGPGRELPLLRWTVATRAGLVGFVEEYDPARARQQFEVWVRALGATPRPERDPAGGRIHLYAVREHYDGLVTVAVVADIDSEAADLGGGRS
jgi:hypothetical protein